MPSSSDAETPCRSTNERCRLEPPMIDGSSSQSLLLSAESTRAASGSRRACMHSALWARLKPGHGSRPCETPTSLHADSKRLDLTVQSSLLFLQHALRTHLWPAHEDFAHAYPVLLRGGCASFILAIYATESRKGLAVLVSSTVELHHLLPLC